MEKSLTKLHKYFYWPSLKKNVKKYIKCVVCVIPKTPNQWYGLYKPFLILVWTWESISLDYLIGYPITKHQPDVILVVVDEFSKMAILIPCKKTTKSQTQKYVQLLFEHVWKYYGLPTTIISNKDSIFVSTFWKTLWQQLDTQLSKSIMFHPQADRQMEVVNCMVVQLLCMYNHKHRRTWDDNLPYIQHSYNCAQHSSTGKSPFDICCGF